MEALHSHSCLPTGEQSGVHDQPQPGESALPLPDPQPPKSPSSQNHEPQTQQTRSKQGGPQQQQQQQQQHHGQHHKLPNKRERKRLRHQRQSVDSDTPPAEDGKHAKAEATPTRVARTSSGGTRANPSSSSTSTQSTEAPDTEENQEGTLKQKRERKPGKPGKYVCSYCGRACAKPSVLQKHIRSHTGERPYPCAPCGFSFKTKSNLYKHRKSHTHRVKAGLASGEPSALEEPVPESEDETRQPLSAASSNMERQGSVANEKTHEDTERSTEQSSGMDNSYAVKKRLAMRLSRGKRGPLGSSDSISSSLGMASIGSRGSTESGYFSRSESTEQSQDIPPNATSAKSYAEIIMGKYGRLGHLQRMSRHQDQQPSGSQGQQEKSSPFTVPKKQVIDHITNLITINEAVVDTSKIDSVKPRRFSLPRRSSNESSSKVTLSLKEPQVVHHSTKNPGDPGFKSSGSITMGVPCEKFHHHQSLHVDSTAGLSPTSMAPLLRSLSMPSAASSTDASSDVFPRNFRLSQSFDERSETQTRRTGMLRRQPAIELQPGAELTKEEHSLHSSSNTLYNHNMSTVPPDHKQCQPEPYECETCGVGCKNWEGYKAHKRSLCIARLPQESLGTTICQLDRSQLIHYPISKPGALAMRKRRKEESFESDDPSSPVSLSIPTFSTSVQGRDRKSVACNRNSWPWVEQERGDTSKCFSVIQHTSSFEKQDPLLTDSQGKEEAHFGFLSHEDVSQKQLQEHSSKPTPRKLVRQHNVQVPEIFITEDSNTNVIESVQTQSETTSIMPKQTERTDEFQWPQRSLTLSGVPIEKLPPKKKRIRLAEAAQSSGESMSSFDSISLPRSPSQDSCASHASSRSASFEESTRPGDMETLAGTPLRRSRAPNMLTVPGLHLHKREMRRSVSEQAPHDPQQQSVLMAMLEMRSKSFDYSSLSPERSAAGWSDRRKCLLMRHTAVKDPEEEQPAKPAELQRNPSSSISAKHTALKVNNPSHCSPSPDPVSPSTSSKLSPGPRRLSATAGSPLSGEPTSCNRVQTLCQEPPSQWKLGQSINLTGHCSEVLPSKNSVESPDRLQRVDPSPLCSGKPLIISLRPVHTYIHPAQPQPRPVYPPHPLSTQCPLGIARAHYLPMSTGLKLEIPVPIHSHDGPSEFVTHPPLILPNISRSPELLRPSISPAVAVVRLQADTNTLASAIYTTQSQTTTSRSQEPVCSGLNSGNRNSPMPEHNSHLVMSLPVSSKMLSGTLLPVSQLALPPGNHLPLPLPSGSKLWSDEDCRSPGSGSNKRLLSPSNSVDFSPESKQQQKRVKEEEEEASCVGNIIVETSTKEEKVEIPTCLPRVCTPISPERPSYPTLQSTTSHSWCYLNYVKPNPSTSTSTDHQPSVYSSWSTSEYDPNPPGLSSKTALSLLDCKQRVCPAIYTMSPMSSTPAETPPEPTGMKTPCHSEVHATLPGDSHHVKTTEQEQSAEDKELKKEREEEDEKEEEEKEEETQSTSKCREPPTRIWICEGGYRSSEEYVYVRGRGRGRYVCEECGIRCKKPSMLRKHIRLHTDSRPYVCKHCNFAFKTKGNLTKHMKSKAHGKKCHDGPMTGSEAEEDCSVWPETGQDEHRYSDISETEADDDDNEYDDEDDDDGEEESWSHEDPSTTSTSHLKPPKPPDQNRTTTDRDRTRPSGSSQPSQPQRLNPQEPSLCYPAASPSKKRALFSRRRHLDPCGHRSPLHCPSPTPALSPSLSLTNQLSPAHSLSPRADLAPLRCPSPRRYLSPVSCHPSPPPLSSLFPRHNLSPAPSPPSSLSLLGCHVSPSLERHPSPLRGLSPVRPKSPSSPSPQATIPAQNRACLPRDPSSNPHRDRPATATSSKARLLKSYSVQEDDEVRLPLLSPRTRPSRGGHGGVLSHLPLHSQQLARTPNLMIPIGGIHMVQPRTSRHFSLVNSPVAAQNTPTPAEMDQSRTRGAGLEEGPLSRPSSLKHHQNPLIEAAGPSTSMHTSYQDNRVGEGEAEGRLSGPLPDKAGTAHLQVCSMRPENHGSLSQREETKLLFTGTELGGSSHSPGAQTSTLSKGTTHTERDTDTHVRGGSLFPVTEQGQKMPSSFQTKL